jgi:hypothetical protein
MAERRKNISCTVPEGIYNQLKLIAEDEGHLMSRKVCKILSDYIKDNQNHKALQKSEN